MLRRVSYNTNFSFLIVQSCGKDIVARCALYRVFFVFFFPVIFAKALNMQNLKFFRHTGTGRLKMQNDLLGIIVLSKFPISLRFK